MTSTPVYSAREVCQKLERAGMVLDRTKGSHRIYKCAGGKLSVVPMHSGDIKRGTLKSIIEGAGLTLLDFIRL